MNEWQVVHQIILLSKVYHREVISIAPDSPMAGHFEVRKTHDRILNHFGFFWWPILKKDVSGFCQVVGRPN